MKKEHRYRATVIWTGNKGSGTKDYTSYGRSHNIVINNKVTLSASSDPAFLGDPSKHNPEDLFLASLSSCHMLWYLHLCAVNNITVVEYTDHAAGTMTEENGKGRFTKVVLQPEAVITDRKQTDRAKELHKEAADHCFIANSCNFPVEHVPEIKVK